MSKDGRILSFEEEKEFWDSVESPSAESLEAEALHFQQVSV